MNNATEYAKALYELMDSVSTKEEFLKDLNETIKVFSGDTLKFFLYPEIFPYFARMFSLIYLLFLNRM